MVDFTLIPLWAAHQVKVVNIFIVNSCHCSITAALQEHSIQSHGNFTAGKYDTVLTYLNMYFEY